MMASFASFSSSVWNLDRYGWILSLIQLFWFRFSYLFPFFLFYLASKKLFSLKLWVVNLIILRCLPFFMPSIGWTLPHALRILFYPAQLHLWLPRITLLPFVSFFLGFQRPATIMHNLPKYWSASSSYWEWDNIILMILTTASFPKFCYIAVATLILQESQFEHIKRLLK